MMRNEATTHVDPIVFWQRACGGPLLSDRDYQHVIACTDCEALAEGIKNALDTIEEKLRHSDRHIS
jgi:hypothetical protein